ncbi:MAG: hypothetical protein ACQEWV_26000 [Bacillota bacterium]
MFNVQLTEKRAGYDSYPPEFQIRYYQPTKPGMNRPESHQEWSINVDTVMEMDFSDKDTMLGEISRYGHFSGVNPSGMVGDGN